MAQFRTTADILDEILLKSGEPTNGNSPFESRAVTYANKVHHAIIGGGNIFNLNVDEPWVWARSRTPINIELLPAYTSGSITCVADSINIVFSTAPTGSVQGWHFQVNGLGTVYKITQHTAGSINAVIDSPFVDSSGTYTYRCFKLDYQLAPEYIYIDEHSDRINFREGTASTTLTASLTHGSYTPANLISHFATQLQAAGSKTYSGTYDSSLNRYLIQQTGTAFTVLGASGLNPSRRNAMLLAGFDAIDYTGAQSYSNTYFPGQIARLIEPFKIFTDRSQPFIYSSDPIRMQQDYPLALTTQAIPSRFVRMYEDNAGRLVVRFNSYPQYKTKVQVDWVPVPIDLQDNAASVPLLPRQDIDVLIHAACAYIAWDKEDSKWDGFLKLAGAGLDAMKKKNHGELFRTGESFGQIVPRLDYANRQRKFNFGYTVSGSGSVASSASEVSAMTKINKNYLSFAAANTQSAVLYKTLAADHTLLSVLVKHSQNFQGTAISSVLVDVGTLTDPDKFISSFDVYQSVDTAAQASALVLFYPAGVATDIYVRMTAVGNNLNALTQGSLDVWFQEITAG